MASDRSATGRYGSGTDIEAIGTRADISFDPISDRAAYPYLNEVELAEVPQFGGSARSRRISCWFRAGDYPVNRHATLAETVRIVNVSTRPRAAMCGVSGM
jgi:hypothetical protein